MAEAGIPVNLPDRGQVVIDYIDLYDEGQCGAGKLAYRGSYETLADVQAAIAEVLTKSPIEDPESATSVLSFGRFNSPDRHGLRENAPGDLYPFKSRWIVHFFLRFKFLEDFCYVELGIPWAPLKNYNTGGYYEKYPLGDYTMGQIFSVSDLSVVQLYNCTATDAYELLKEFNLTDPQGNDLTDPSLGVSPEQMEELGDIVILLDEGALLKDDNVLLVESA